MHIPSSEETKKLYDELNETINPTHEELDNNSSDTASILDAASSPLVEAVLEGVSSLLN